MYACELICGSEERERMRWTCRCHGRSQAWSACEHQSGHSYSQRTYMSRGGSGLTVLSRCPVHQSLVAMSWIGGNFHGYQPSKRYARKTVRPFCFSTARIYAGNFLGLSIRLISSHSCSWFAHSASNGSGTRGRLHTTWIPGTESSPSPC